MSQFFGGLGKQKLYENGKHLPENYVFALATVTLY